MTASPMTPTGRQVPDRRHAARRLILLAALLALLPLAAQARAHATTAGAITLRYHFVPGQRFTFHYIEHGRYDLQGPDLGKAPYHESYADNYIESVRVVSVTATGAAGVVIRYTGAFTDTVNGKTTVQTSTLASAAKNEQRGMLLGADNALPSPSIFWPTSYGHNNMGALGLFPPAPVATDGQWRSTAAQDLTAVYYQDAAFPSAPPATITANNRLLGVNRMGMTFISSGARIDYSADGTTKKGATRHIRFTGSVSLGSAFDVKSRQLLAGTEDVTSRIAVTDSAGKTLLSGTNSDTTQLEPTDVAPF